MCALTYSEYYQGRLFERTIKIFIIQDCPFSLSVNGKRVSSMSSFKGFSEHFTYTCFNQFSSTIPVFFVFSFYHIPCSHSFMLFGLPTIKRRHMKSVYQFKCYLYLKLIFVCWMVITFYAHWTIIDDSPRKCNYFCWIVGDIVVVLCILRKVITVANVNPKSIKYNG